MMKKVGILTMYYKSINYGGLLQAYALCKYINEIGEYIAEQVCCENTILSVSNSDRLKRICNEGFMETLRSVSGIVSNKVNKLVTNCFLSQKLEERLAAIAPFREAIPHSEVLYNYTNISETEYDIFVVGSDRVWNPNNLQSLYYLNFVKNKKKLSYAASVTANIFTPEQKKFLCETLENYSGISVREKNTAEVLSTFVSKDVQWVCDPVMLLDELEWNKLCPDRKIKDDYIFCYLLGKDNNNRKLVKQFASKQGLKIITVPHANNQSCKSDYRFGDIQLFDLSPADFLSYIKHSRFVFTDSFHATVFSTIFNKEVFSLSRKELNKSGSRIESFTTFAGIEDHYCSDNTRRNTAYLLEVGNIDYNLVNRRIKDFREKSQEYLKDALAK